MAKTIKITEEELLRITSALRRSASSWEHSITDHNHYHPDDPNSAWLAMLRTEATADRALVASLEERGQKAGWP